MKSKVNSSYKIYENLWVVSVINTGSKLSGHSQLVVEGIVQNEPFVKIFDIRATPTEARSSFFNRLNAKGVITKIVIHEQYKEGRDYERYTSKSYYAEPEHVNKTIEAIKAEKDRCDQGDYLPMSNSFQ